MGLNKEKLSVAQAKELLLEYGMVFDIVRFVDPVARKEFVLHDNGTLSMVKYYCYKVWNKIERCENCISLRAQCDHCRKTKYEFIKDEIYQVIVLPVVICDQDANCVDAVLELVNNATDEIVFEAFGRAELIEKINQTNKKIYQDSLTQVYNRRYFDERVFCYAGETNMKKDVSFVMIDLRKFKSINDTYGHEIGDAVLSAVGTALKGAVRSTDSVIRMGGDEFLVVLKDCKKENILSVIDNMRNAIRRLTFEQEKDLSVDANFGYAFTKDFLPSDDCISELLHKADMQMYEEKQSR